MYLEIYKPDTAKFISALALAREAALKQMGVELDLLTNVDMLLIVEKGL